MGSDEGIKAIQPYLQRAEEVAKVEPKIAYYCRLHALETAMSPAMSPMSADLKDLVRLIMGQLEKDKAKLDLSNSQADQYYCEAFALGIFKRADGIDRAGKGNQTTAKAFYAASVFIDILNHFSRIDSDLESKQKYALWKAGDIRLALKQGIKPQIGSPNDKKIAFRVGAKVLFAAEETDIPELGTVAKIEMIGDEQTFVVALKEKFVQAPAHCLAPHVTKGDPVWYTPPSGSEIPATLLQMETQHWPPSYVVELEDGTVKDTAPDRISHRVDTHTPPAPANSAGSSLPDPPNGVARPQVVPDTVAPPSDQAASNWPPAVSAPPQPTACKPAPADHELDPSPGGRTKPAPSYQPAPSYPPPPPVLPAQSSYPAGASPPVVASPVVQSQQPVSAANAPQSAYKGPSGYMPSAQQMAMAKQHSKSAASALDFDDVQTAAKLMSNSLELLTNASHAGFNKATTVAGLKKGAVSDSRKLIKSAASSLDFGDVPSAVQMLTTALQHLSC